MRTYLDCIPCFFKQVLRTARLTGLSEKDQRALLVEFGMRLSDFSIESTPPEIARSLYASIMKRAGRDPFREIREKSNRYALELYPALKKRIRQASDPLRMAARLAIAGNIIDYGIPRAFDLQEEIEVVLRSEFGAFEYDVFLTALDRSETLLYLCDNAGEIVFDRLLIEEIQENYPVVITAAVRGGPVLNDVIFKDAEQVGMDRICRVITNGVNAPGTLLGECSDDFTGVYQNSDLVISKGQGNFESLWGEKKRIFFFFKIKCDVVARHVNGRVGDTVLLASA